MKEEVVKEKECTRGNTPSFEWPDQTNPQFGGTNDLPKNSWGVSTEIKRFWFRELHIFVRTITSQNKGYFKTSAEGLIKHKPCLEGRNKREPWQKGNRNENEHTHTCVIYTGNLAHRFPYYCFLQPGSECYCNLQQTHCRFKSLHNQSGTQAKLKSLTQQPFFKIRNRQEFLSLQNHEEVQSEEVHHWVRLTLRRPQPVGMNASAIENTSPIVSGVFLTVTTRLAIIAVNSNAWNVRTVSWKLADILSLNEKIWCSSGTGNIIQKTKLNNCSSISSGFLFLKTQPLSFLFIQKTLLPTAV